MANNAEAPLPVAPLPDILGWWQAEEVRGVVIGGLAVALRGRPRVTRDIDALVLLPEERWPALLETARRFGLVPRLDDALAFAHESRVLLLRHDATGIDVDSLLEAHPDLDTRRVRRWVRAFAEALEMPDIYADLKRQLRRRGHGPKKDSL